MSGPAVIPPDPTPESHERALYARLGLSPDATREEVVAAYDAVADYLDHAPRELRDWANARAEEADEAFAILSDPAALAGAVALVGTAARPAHAPGGSATPPTRRAAPVDEVLDDEDGPELEELIASVTPGTHRDTIGGPRRARRVGRVPPGIAGTARRGMTAPGAARGRALRRIAIVGGVAIAAIAIAVAGYNFGPGAAPAVSAQQSPSPSASPALDQAKVADLMARIQANPRDVASLLALADAFGKAGDDASAGDWATKALAVDPKNVDGYLALGVAQFNLGYQTKAEASWKQAVAVDSKNVLAHYYLGFLYFAETPQDVAGATSEWKQVIALDPTSDIAKSVQAHLDSLTGASPAPSGSAPSGSAGASATPSGSPQTSPATSPTASPAPSGSAQP